MSFDAMKLALYALERGETKLRYEAITTLRTAIEQAQEPIAWMVYTLDGKSVCVTDNPADFSDQHKALPLYTSPRQWQGLMDEDREEILRWVEWKEIGSDQSVAPQKLIAYVEKKLREKNT